MKKITTVLAIIMVTITLSLSAQNKKDLVDGKYKILEQTPNTEVEAGKTLITGRVMDFMGRPIAASVSIEGTNYGMFVDSLGKYKFIVPAGKYKIKAEYTGCNALKTSTIDCKPQQKTVINLLLGTSMLDF